MWTSTKRHFISMAAASPRISNPRESLEESFNDLDLEVTYHRFCFLLFLRSESLNPA